MQIRIAAPSPALAAASIADNQIAGVSVEGPFLVFDFGGANSLQERLDIVASMEATAGQLIADADDANDINALTQLKRSIAGITSDVTRESYMLDQIAEATNDQTGSHPTSTGVASTSLSSQQHGVASEQKEEISNEQEQQAQPSRKQRSGR
jgi:hypothetical protein